MSFGITVLNQDGRTQIDEIYSNQSVVTESISSASYGAAYPPSGYASSDLVLTKAPTGVRSLVCRDIYYNSPKFGAYTNRDYSLPVPPAASTYNYYLARKNTGYLGAGTDFGLDVYNSAGETVFSATSRNKILQCVAAGTSPNGTGSITSMSSTWETTSDLDNVVYYPSSTGTVSDLDKHYVPLNNTQFYCFDYYSTEIGSMHVERVFAYEYIWTSGTAGRIKIHNYYKAANYDWFSPGPNAFAPTPYMIFKEAS